MARTLFMRTLKLHNIAFAFFLKALEKKTLIRVLVFFSEPCALLLSDNRTYVPSIKVNYNGLCYFERSITEQIIERIIA